MSYIYHLAPQDLRGTKLYPLNKLKTVFPELYEQHAQKYSWRKETMQGHIPILNCLWNDVLHFSPVHPSLVKSALQGAGFKVGQWRVFKFDARKLEPEKTVLYRYLHQDRRDKYTLPGNFEPFSTEQLSEINDLSQRTKSYYRETFREGKRPLMFVGVPHVLYKGSLDISEVEILEL